MSYGTNGLTFNTLREANVKRLPEFKDAQGRICHPHEPGIEPGFNWDLSKWSNAILGELGEAANIIKKIERGDFPLHEARAELADELADVAIYLDLLAYRAGVNLGEVIMHKWNRTSAKVGCDIRIKADDWYRLIDRTGDDT